jgi:predicted  nucleic acid-binding Zn-ribbon protein
VQMQGEFEARLGEHGQRHQADLSALEARMRQEVAAEQLRVAELAAQVEQDTVRMRKLTNQKRVQEQEVARLKTQLRSAVSSDAVGEGVSEAMSELKSMEQQLKDAHAEIATLRSRVAAAGEAGRGVITAGASGSLGAPARLTAAEQAHAMVAVPAEGAFGSLSYAGYLEQADYTEKRIKQLADEKRSLIAKNLEEVREKNELLQKLLAIEKEFSDLKSEKRKIELDNRRMDARLEKLLTAQTGGNKENVVN